MNELIELVNKLRRQHYICEDDCTISCPLAVNEDGESACCNDSWLSANAENAHKCTCGADEHNALVDEVIKRLKGDDSIIFVCPDCQRVTVDPADVAALEADNKRLRDALTKIYELNCELGYTLRMARIGWDGTETCENTLEPINVIAKAMGEANPMGKEYRRLRDAVERLTSAGLSAAQGEVAKEDELDFWIRSWTEKDAQNATLAAEARQLRDEVARLEAQLSTKLTDIVDGNRELIEALRAVKAER